MLPLDRDNCKVRNRLVMVCNWAGWASSRRCFRAADRTADASHVAKEKRDLLSRVEELSVGFKSEQVRDASVTQAWSVLGAAPVGPAVLRCRSVGRRA